MQLPNAVIFDLDGVLVDTARFHYLAWKKIASELGLEFSEQDNEKLKGVSRDRSLEIILELNNKSGSETDRKYWLERKNDIYLTYIETLSPEDILPGALNVIQLLKQEQRKIALGSASKNAVKILRATGIHDYFDAIVDGTCVTRAKPDPEVFLEAAARLQAEPGECLVFEDAAAGVDAALAAGMAVVGIGDKAQLDHANSVVADLQQYLTGITNQ